MPACEQGVTAVEFAILAPALLLLMMGIIEVSLIMFTSSVMEGSTTETARLGKTGATTSGLTRQQSIINSVNAKTAGLLDPTKIVVTYEVYASLSSIGGSEPCLSPVTPPCSGTAGINFVDINGNGVWDGDTGSAGLGNAGDVVVYTVSYPWKITTPFLQWIFGSTYMITARSVVRNEPY